MRAAFANRNAITSLYKREARCHRFELACIDCLEERLDHGQVDRVLFDEVDENRGVESDGAAPEIAQESQESRSARTCSTGSISLQSSLPKPRSSRIDCSFGLLADSSRK